MFKKRESIKQVEESSDLAPKFDENGYIPVVTTDVKSGIVLMHAYMNEEALKKTIITKEAHYYSRSRKCLWHKGATSGLIQDVKNIFIDDDQDCIWLNVAVRGEASCHVGYKSCFYREIDMSSKQLELKFIEDENSNLIENGSFKLSESQSKSILEIRLSRLTGLEREKLTEDLKECVEMIKEFLVNFKFF